MVNCGGLSAIGRHRKWPEKHPKIFFLLLPEFERKEA